MRGLALLFAILVSSGSAFADIKGLITELVHVNGLFLDDVSVMTVNGNVLKNGSFENGTLDAWYKRTIGSTECTRNPQFCAPWRVTKEAFRSGSHSAFVAGSLQLEQFFKPVSTNNITSFTYWGKALGVFEDTALILSVEMLFSDGTALDTAGFGDVRLRDTEWHEFDANTFLPRDKELVGIRFSGTDPVVRRFGVPEPGSFTLFLLGLAGLPFFRKLRRIKGA
jgi:hypothetical protein